MTRQTGNLKGEIWRKIVHVESGGGLSLLQAGQEGWL